MAHLSLQIGAAIVVPIGSVGSRWRSVAWRRRALQEIAGGDRQAIGWPAAQLRAPRAHGFKMRRAPRLVAFRETS